VVAVSFALASKGRELYKTAADKEVPKSDRARSYDDFNYTGTTQYPFRDIVRTERTQWSTNTTEYPNNAWMRLPKFAIYHPDHAWLDYFKGDVPSFYHRLGSRDLLNSRGDVVDVAAVSAWQQDNLSNVVNIPNISANFFPRSSVSLIISQVNGIKAQCATAAGRRKYLQKSLYNLFRLDQENTSKLKALIRLMS
jgi:hypothetical protein